MINLFIVELSAEARTKIVEEINGYFSSDLNLLSFLPRINVRPLSLDELKFNSAPDIILVGEEVVKGDLSEISKIRRLFPTAAILVRITSGFDSLPVIEQLARLGADDVIKPSTQPEEFLKKLILLSRNGSKTKSGKLIVVEGGKGGVGVTSIACGFAEALVSFGKKVCLVDLDFETQDLSRFLQARPFVNENLSLLFSGQRPIIQEAVEHCINQVWADSDSLFVMSPPADCDELYDSKSSCARSLISVLEVLDSMFDVVIVDSSSSRGAMRKSLCRVADDLIFVASNDAASLFSSVDRLSKAISDLSPGCKVVVVENRVALGGLPSKMLFQELTRASKIPIDEISSTSVSYSKSGSTWPGSGGTLYSQGGEMQSLRDIGVALGLMPENASRNRFAIKPLELFESVFVRRRVRPNGNGAMIPPIELLPDPNLQTLPPPPPTPSLDEDAVPSFISKIEAKDLVKGAKIFQ